MAQDEAQRRHVLDLFTRLPRERQITFLAAMLAWKADGYRHSLEHYVSGMIADDDHDQLDLDIWGWIDSIGA